MDDFERKQTLSVKKKLWKMSESLADTLEKRNKFCNFFLFRTFFLLTKKLSILSGCGVASVKNARFFLPKYFFWISWFGTEGWIDSVYIVSQSAEPFRCTQCIYDSCSITKSNRNIWPKISFSNQKQKHKGVHIFN